MNAGPICVEEECSPGHLSSGLVYMGVIIISSKNHITVIACSLRLDKDKGRLRGNVSWNGILRVRESNDSGSLSRGFSKCDMIAFPLLTTHASYNIFSSDGNSVTIYLSMQHVIRNPFNNRVLYLFYFFEKYLHNKGKNIFWPMY